LELQRRLHGDSVVIFLRIRDDMFCHTQKDLAREATLEQCQWLQENHGLGVRRHLALREHIRVEHMPPPLHMDFR